MASVTDGLPITTVVVPNDSDYGAGVNGSNRKTTEDALKMGQMGAYHPPAVSVGVREGRAPADEAQWRPDNETGTAPAASAAPRAW